MTLMGAASKQALQIGGIQQGCAGGSETLLAQRMHSGCAQVWCHGMPCLTVLCEADWVTGGGGVMLLWYGAPAVFPTT